MSVPQLGLSALFFHPSLAEAVARVRVAEAAEVTAGTPPELTASAEVSRAAKVDEGKSSPWSVSLATGITIEMGGKRNARRERARAATLLARLRLEAVGWQLVTSAEQAALRTIGAAEELADVESERATLAEVATLVRARYAEGRVSVVDAAQADQDTRVAMLAVAQTARSLTATRLELARALALPFRAVDSLRLADPRAALCSSVALRFDSVGAIALHRRAEVASLLAAYRVAEAELRIEVARQYPDLSVGPGLAWDQGVMRWLIALGTPGVPRDVNRGPIAEARARRAAEAARVASVQDSVLAAVDSAVVACRDVRGEIDAAAAVEQSANQSLRTADAAYARGEIGRTEVVLARFAVVRAVRAMHIARRRALDATAALNAATGSWTGPEPRWPDLMLVPHSMQTGTGVAHE